MIKMVELVVQKAVYKSMKRRFIKDIETYRENPQTPFFSCSLWTFQFLGKWQFRGEYKAH